MNKPDPILEELMHLHKSFIETVDTMLRDGSEMVPAKGVIDLLVIHKQLLEVIKKLMEEGDGDDPEAAPS